MDEQWELGVVNARLQRKMYAATDRVLQRWAELRRDGEDARVDDAVFTAAAGPELRTAALVAAIERLARVTLQRGIWP